jgi:hypothetical protein
LLIDAPTLVAAGALGLAPIERTLRLAARLRERSVLDIIPLGQLSRSLAQRPKTTPAYSILRAA